MDDPNQEQTQTPGRERSRRPMPPELRGFNMGAFLMSYYWAFNNGFKGLGCVLSIPFGLFFINIITTDHLDGVVISVFLMMVIAAVSFVLGTAGNSMAWRKGHFDDIEGFCEWQKEFTKPGQLAWFWGFHLVLPISLFLLTVNMMRPGRSPRARVGACRSQLEYLRTAADDYVVEGKQLSDLSENASELCVHLYAGAEVPADCADALLAKLNQVCEQGSFQAKIIGDNRFEFTAVAKDRNKTKICATENAVLPDPYDGKPDNDNRFHCDHGGGP